MNGSRRAFCTTVLASFLALSAPVAAEDARVHVSVVGGVPATRLTVIAESPSGLTRSSSLVLGETRETWLTLTADEAWSVQGQAEGFWIQRASVSAGSEVTLRLWPAAEFRVGLQTAPLGRAVPARLELKLSTPVSGARSPDQPDGALVACPVDANHVALCPVPAGTWDLRAKSAGFVPHFLWAQAFAAGGKGPGGRWMLVEGTSVFGRVVTDSGPADPKLAKVGVEPAVERDAGAPGAPRTMGQLALSLAINQWGYFQSDALASGRYVVTARQPGFEAATQTVTVRSDADTELADPLVLSQPLQLSVLVDPPSAPGGRPWQVELMGVRQGDLKSVARGATGEKGTWLSPAIAPGVYTAWVVSGRSRLASREIVLSRDSRDLAFFLDLVRVKGNVRIGDEAIQADVWFGGRSGKVRVKAESDPFGRFDVILPRAGAWVVDVHGRSRPVEVDRLPVEVEKPAPGAAAEVSIVVPDTTVLGTVVDVAGHPVAAAQVQLVRFERPGAVGTATDATGTFEIQGQPPGSYSIEASDSTRSSERIDVSIAEQTVPSPLELVLVEPRRLAGKVVSRSGPVPGAFVLGLPIKADGTMAGMAAPQGRSELDGSFELELPPQSVRVRVIVTIPGHPLAVMLVQTAVAQVPPIVVTLGDEQGSLELPSPDPSGGDAGGTVGLVLVDGQALDLNLLAMWAQANGAAVGGALLSVDAMPPGSYAYCELALSEAMLVLTGAALPTKQACSEGYLSAGSKLALARPSG